MTIEKIILDPVKTMKNETQRSIDNHIDAATPVNPKTPDLENANSGNDDNKVTVINACGRNRRLNIMVVGAALGLIFCILTLTSYSGNLPGEVVGIISTVSGIFGACLKDAYSFEFGSSRGSKDKDDKISSTILRKIKY
ncbi:MAG: hypothetical protein LBC04_02025 [Holosporaceae bacterium]|jgi:hypothetical protein|nr:hypothetical protein [Holosporaceae bacterium]